ncbi:MAG TPA: alpha-amylase family glycosyl hydrolase [Anaeromyxobacteraceae bacterium]|nr:alpha-amylase family glycosyl hydrolase [Anaeromyxobacteraceae bacterium]
MSQAVRMAAVRSLLAALAAAAGCVQTPAGVSAAPSWWRDRVAYEIFVRSFADSDGDGVGDLRGLTARLDYLNDGDPATTADLGVDAVWLMPVFPSPSYHGYDVADYRGVNPQYGTLADLDAFVQGAHRRGIKVILDMVLNHSSSVHPWFQDSQQGPAAARRAWYSWRDALPTTGWRRPWDGTLAWYALNGSYYYGLFSPSMPDLNLGNPAVEHELVDSMKFWLARGVDGFRLDAVRHYFESADGVVVDQPESHAFLRRIRTALEDDHPGVLLVAEAWAPLEIATTYRGSGDEAQLGFAFDLADALVGAAGSGDAAAVVNVLARTEAALPGEARAFDAPFLSNHDQVRVMRALGGDAAAARVAAAALLALPGTPFLYYGEEIGMQGGAASDDRNKRTPFRWTAAAPGYGFTTGSAWFSATEATGVDLASQQADPASLWNAYRRLVALRHAQPALADGDAVRPAVTGGGPGAFALLRAGAGQRVLFVANFAAAPTGAFSVDASGTPHTLESEGLAGPPVPGGGKLAFPGLDARAWAFLQLE